MKTIEEFKTKWAAEISAGIVQFLNDDKDVSADRYNGNTDEFLCDRKQMNKIQADLRKIGYRCNGFGSYTTREYIEPSVALSNIINEFTAGQWTDKLVLEFVREATKGQYGAFKDAPKLEDKLIIFKGMNGIK